EVDPDWHCEWNGAPLELPGGGTLCLVRGATAGTQPLPAFVVGYRRGGEKLKPAGKPHTRELRLLLQELGVPPWERPRLPLVFADGELAAVGDIVLSAAGQNLLERLGARIVWTRPHETL
ncbi:MAG TPA: tRNA lysidine(34) synthetase TilS, partial [Rudaea sp.]|nr:tRNA lysidine(34) synthetase TilS [Rudaea sp.]